MHGTTYGYTRHACRCDDCRKAQTDYIRSYRATKEGGDRSRAQNRAERRAEMRLRRMFPAEFGKFLEEERAKEPVLQQDRRRKEVAE